MSKRAVVCLAWIAVLAVVAYTQLIALTEIPGLHFDEAWQGLYANRIASEPGFWPIQAMNSYTSPVVHYPLALAFRVFGPSLETMRGFYAALNFTALAIFAWVLRRRAGNAAALVFAAFWGALPLAVHSHRFYVEMTGFFALCLALLALSLECIKSKPRLSLGLLAISAVLGAYCHILYFATLFALWAAYLVTKKGDGTAKKFRQASALVSVALLPLLFRMAYDLAYLHHKKAAVAFLLVDLFILASAIWPKTLPKIISACSSKKVLAVLAVVSGVYAIHALAVFLFLMLSGAWPYAQATGKLSWFWAAPNMLFFGWIAWKIKSRWKQLAEAERFLFLWFALALILTCVMSFKPAPRYVFLPSVLAMVGGSFFLVRVLRPRRLLWTILVFVALNLAFFQKGYLQEFRQNGPTNDSFRVLAFNDSGRDFRPFQKVFAWLKEKNCHFELRWVEDDRFLLPLQFMRLTAPPAIGACPWGGDDTFFTHKPKPDYLRVSLLAHEKGWGDLAIFLRDK